ncbi:MAG: YihY/virulence factor BrkB family protein, partial [Acidimicrobiales bacterium]
MVLIGEKGPAGGGTAAPVRAGVDGGPAGPAREDVDEAPGRLDAYQQRHPWLGFPVAVTYKFFEDQGNFLAALITYYGFISLFFLLLLLVTVLGFLAQGDPGLRSRLLHSALIHFPIVGSQIQLHVHSLRGGIVRLVIGVVVCIHGGLEVVQAGWNAFNRVWAVPRQDRLNPIQTRARSAVVLVVLGLGVLLTTGLSGFTTNAVAYLGPWGRVAGTLLSGALNIAIFVFAFRWLTSVALSVRDVAPGAVLAGICWQVLQSLGTYYVARQLQGVSAIGGLFGVVLGLLAWIYLEAVVTVVCAEINAVGARRLWPRGLRSLFTDTRRLTEADLRIYESYAQIERY